jgi:hypothetical protein
MAAISPSWPSMLRRKLLVIAMISLPFAPSELKADVSQEAPKAVPQDPRATAQDKRPGETLSERLDRNSGVIHPPEGVDPGIAVPAPDPNPNSTPVIPPPGTPGGNPSVQPK